eukprot:7294308-Prymnesium_polylepis.1
MGPAGLLGVHAVYGMPGHHTLESLCKEAAVAPEKPQPWTTHFAGLALRSQTRGPLASAGRIIQETVDANAKALPSPGPQKQEAAATGAAAYLLKEDAGSVEPRTLVRQQSSSLNSLVPSMTMVPSSLRDEARKLARQSSNLVGFGSSSHKVCLIGGNEDEEEGLQRPISATPALLVRFDGTGNAVRPLSGNAEDLSLRQTRVKPLVSPRVHVTPAMSSSPPTKDGKCSGSGKGQDGDAPVKLLPSVIASPP